MRPYQIKPGILAEAIEEADCLADARSLVRALFRRNNQLRFLDIFYGDALVETIHKR